MQKLKKIIKLVFINIVLVAGLLLLLNAVSFLCLKWGVLKNDSGHTADSPSADPYQIINNHHNAEYNKSVLNESKQAKLKYTPFTGWTTQPFDGKMLTVNQEGDRVHFPPDSPSPDTAKTVRFFGGSSMWGFGVDDNGTIPAIYNQLVPDKHVYNHGEKGFTTRQNLARLVNLVNQNDRIDQVVFYDGYNDVLNMCYPGSGYNSTPFAISLQQNMKDIRTGVLIKKGIQALFVGYLKKLIDQLKSDSNTKTDIWKNSKCCNYEYKNVADSISNTLIHNWTMAKLLVEAEGGAFVALLQPNLFVGKPLLDKRIIIDKPDCLIQTIKTVYKKVREQLSDVSWFYDLSDAYDIQEPVLFDGIHASEKGHIIIAQKVADILE